MRDRTGVARGVSPAEPVSHLRRIPIIECGEPLIDFLEFCPNLLLDKPVWNYTRVTLVRKSVAEKLSRAVEYLPKGFRLAILEGWRPLHIQKRMYMSALKRWRERHPEYSEAALRRLVNRFTAPPDTRVPPPHTTGGAVDVMLTDEEGNHVDLISPFERRDRRCYAFDAKGLSEEARKNRAILAGALFAAGLTNYPSEYWHWSYGDQGWAYRGGYAHAIYDAIEPPGYTPYPEDDSDEPLEWVG